jgi:hypothetical protein
MPLAARLRSSSSRAKTRRPDASIVSLALPTAALACSRAHRADRSVLRPAASTVWRESQVHFRGEHVLAAPDGERAHQAQLPFAWCKRPMRAIASRSLAVPVKNASSAKAEPSRARGCRSRNVEWQCVLHARLFHAVDCSAGPSANSLTPIGIRSSVRSGCGKTHQILQRHSRAERSHARSAVPRPRQYSKKLHGIVMTERYRVPSQN